MPFSKRLGGVFIVYQSIEQMLKILLNRGRIIATASQLKAWKDKAPAPYAKHMLGMLIDPLIDHHLSPGGPDGLVLPKSTEAVFGYEFRIHLTDEQRANFKARMEEMVKQRNELMHHLLDWMCLDTIEGCQSACGRLRRQREEIEPLRRDIRNILKNFLESREETAAHPKSTLADLLKSTDTTSRPC